MRINLIWTMPNNSNMSENYNLNLVCHSILFNIRACHPPAFPASLPQNFASISTLNFLLHSCMKINFQNYF